MYSGFRHEDRRNAKNCHPNARRRAMADKLHPKKTKYSE
jgi:hypothetical protein